MVAKLIADRFGVTLNANSVGRLLTQLGITRQKPLHRARECDRALVEQWLKKEHPKIKALAQGEKAEIFFGDAAHMRSHHHAGRTWGKKGERNHGCTPSPEPDLGNQRARPDAVHDQASRRGHCCGIQRTFEAPVRRRKPPGLSSRRSRTCPHFREDQSFCRRPERQTAAALSSALLARPQSR